MNTERSAFLFLCVISLAATTFIVEHVISGQLELTRHIERLNTELTYRFPPSYSATPSPTQTPSRTPELARYWCSYCNGNDESDFFDGTDHTRHFKCLCKRGEVQE